MSGWACARRHPAPRSSLPAALTETAGRMRGQKAHLADESIVHQFSRQVSGTVACGRAGMTSLTR